MAESGEILKNSLGLENFKNAYVQRTISTATPIFVITVDSRFPSKFISTSRIRNLVTTMMGKITKKGSELNIKNLKLTPPIELGSFSGIIPGNAIVLFRDIAGEYFFNKNLYSK